MVPSNSIDASRWPLRTIGRTSLAVSVLGLGTAPLGGLYRTSSDGEAVATVRRAAAQGISYFDTAPQYGLGLAEQRIGMALRDNELEGAVVSTKVGRVLEPTAKRTSSDLWPEALPFAERYDVSAEGIARSLADSRERMGRDSVDIALLHDPDFYATDARDLRRLIAEAYATLSKLRAEGRVEAIGLGVNSAAACHMALDLGEWDCMMLAGTYSVLRQDDEGLLDRCHKENVSVLVAGPFMSGALAGGSHWRYRDIPAEIAARIQLLRQLADQHAVPIEALALQFPLAHPAVASVVTGMRSAEEVSANVGHLNRAIAAACWDELASNSFLQSSDVERLRLQ